MRKLVDSSVRLQMKPCQHCVDCVAQQLAKNSSHRTINKLLLLFFLLLFNFSLNVIDTTSINYGVSQRPITDISQLMPVLCQNQSVICEGSFCIPGVKKCVCDLRQPVAFGRFCLRQIDIETKCFATSQCNHTIKDAVCIDTNSQAVLDFESSKFKLEQWQHLNELRSVQSKDSPSRLATTTTTPRTMYVANERGNNADDGLVLDARDDVIMTNMRNSPYEITTPELLQQNHTRRKQTVDQLLLNLSATDETRAPFLQPRDFYSSNHESVEARRASTHDITTPPVAQLTATSTLTTTTIMDTTTIEPSHTTQETYTANNAKLGELSKKKMIVKTPNWPPGVCSCPHGFMFDAMLRKCLGRSLADAHCQIDNDCKQIKLTHCSDETKKCECDEPFIWNQTEMSCQRPTKGTKADPYSTTTIATASTDFNNNMITTLQTSLNYPYTPATKDSTSNKEGVLENLLPPLLPTMFIPNQTVFLLIFVIVIIVATLIILKLTVKCFSSSNSTLISPQSSKGKHNKSGASGTTGLPPRSPYATLKRPEYHNKHSQFTTQATRGRILNYDFEQDSPVKTKTSDSRTLQSLQPEYSSSATMHRSTHSKNDYRTTTTIERQTGGGTLSRLKMHMHNSKTDGEQTGRSHNKALTDVNDHSVQNGTDGQAVVQGSNDNISISQLELEDTSDNSKSETSSFNAIPVPPPSNQPPPYMLASSSMKVQGSAIAAAAAAVANRRIQMAQKKTQAQTGDQQQSGKVVANGSMPVFL